MFAMIYIWEALIIHLCCMHEVILAPLWDCPIQYEAIRENCEAVSCCDQSGMIPCVGGKPGF